MHYFKAIYYGIKPTLKWAWHVSVDRTRLEDLASAIKKTLFSHQTFIIYEYMYYKDLYVRDDVYRATCYKLN